MKHLSHINRHFSLSSIEQVRSKVEEDYPCSIMQNRQEPERHAVVSKYLSLKVIHDDGMEHCERYDRTIESFCPCKRYFWIQERRLIKSVSIASILSFVK
jgi:hypothetical protein